MLWFEKGILCYSGPCIFKPPTQPDECDLKLEAVLKRREFNILKI